MGLILDLPLGGTELVEEVVWKAQADAEDVVRRARVAPHDREIIDHLARVRAFGPQMDRTVRSFMARTQQANNVEIEARALVDGLQESIAA
jgi:hypothetical protein